MQRRNDETRDMLETIDREMVLLTQDLEEARQSREVDALCIVMPSDTIPSRDLCAERPVAALGLAADVVPAIDTFWVPRSDQIARGVHCCAVCFMTGNRSGGTGGSVLPPLVLPASGLVRAAGEPLCPDACACVPPGYIPAFRPPLAFPFPWGLIF